jgi:hypothetical protein
MPTYNFRCKECGRECELFLSIRTYSDGDFAVPGCLDHGRMERILCTFRGNAIQWGANFGDRHYLDLRATDGTPIDSRSKQREYMKIHGLTTMDDFGDKWKKDQAVREAFREGRLIDRDLTQTIADAVYGRITNGR